MSKLTLGNLNKSAKKIAVIMAGGSGTRFWPLSRRSFPKQFLPFGDDKKSLIQDTYNRVKPIVDDVLVVTASHQVELVKEHLPNVCILAEPCPRNTAACVAYASKYIESEVGDVATLFLPADHKIFGEKEIQNTFSKALDVAEQNPVLVTIGIVPRKPETAYGYIKKGEVYNQDSFLVENFYEKPNLEKAKQYYDSGDFFWNSGVFAWKVSSINSKLQEFLPEVFNKIKDFDFSLNSSKLSEQLNSSKKSTKAQESNKASAYKSTLESVRSPGQSDFLPSIPDGEITFLNAKANAYAIFVRRVALQVFGALRKHSWSSLGRRDIASASSTTTIRATLSAKGKLLGIEQLSSSGSKGFDAVVKRASQEGAWDHNPPAGAKAGDGKIYFIFKSRSWTRAGAGSHRERRWILLSTGLL